MDGLDGLLDIIGRIGRIDWHRADEEGCLGGMLRRISRRDAQKDA